MADLLLLLQAKGAANLQPPEMQPNPGWCRVSKGKAIFEETRTTYYLFSFKIHVHQKNAVHPEK
jgi:hypothetical protein